jgi:hypothetical protein
MIRRILGALCALALLGAPCASLAQAMQFNPGGGSSGSVWGTITGTLSSQSDLNTALNGKAGLTANNTFTASPTSFTGHVQRRREPAIGRVDHRPGLFQLQRDDQLHGHRDRLRPCVVQPYDRHLRQPHLLDGNAAHRRQPNVRIMTLDASRDSSSARGGINPSGTNRSVTSIAHNRARADGGRIGVASS